MSKGIKTVSQLYNINWNEDEKKKLVLKKINKNKKEGNHSKSILQIIEYIGGH